MEEASRVNEKMMTNTPARSHGEYTAAGPAGGTGAGDALSSFMAAIAGLFSCSSRKIYMNDRVYRVVRHLADGGFASVFLCDMESGRPFPGIECPQFAVKQILAQSNEAQQLVRNEVQCHVGLRGAPHIMPLLDYTFERVGADAEKGYLVFPFYSGGSLQDFLLRRLPLGPFFSEQDALRLLLQASTGVAALHHCSPPMAHRDLCPRNIMLDVRGEAVVIDLGSAVPAEVSITTRADAVRVLEQAQTHSSMPYRAIELWDPDIGTTIDARTDVWSLGATLYAMLYGYSPFESMKAADGTLKLAECSHTRTLSDLYFPPTPTVSSPTCDLMAWMCKKDHMQRPTIDQVIARLQQLLPRGTGTSPHAGGVASGSSTSGTRGRSASGTGVVGALSGGSGSKGVASPAGHGFTQAAAIKTTPKPAADVPGSGTADSDDQFNPFGHTSGTASLR